MNTAAIEGSPNVNVTQGIYFALVEFMCSNDLLSIVNAL